MGGVSRSGGGGAVTKKRAEKEELKEVRDRGEILWLRI
jgi:hypothetical protein